MWNPLRRQGKRNFRVQSVSVNIPYVGGATFVPDEAEVRAAWALFVELSTRVPIQPVDAEYGSIKETLNSIYAIFGETRGVLKEFGPNIAHGKNSLGPLALGVLNNGLRPFLTKWHTEFAAHEGKRDPTKEPMQHERDWPLGTEFRKAIDELRLNLEQYRDELLVIAGARMED